MATNRGSLGRADPVAKVGRLAEATPPEGPLLPRDCYVPFKEALITVVDSTVLFGFVSGLAAIPGTELQQIVSQGGEQGSRAPYFGVHLDP